MKKTVIGQVLNIILIWALYMVYRVKDAFYLAYEGKYLENTHLLRLLLSAGIVFLVLGLMFYIKMKDNGIRGVKTFLKTDLSVVEEDERDKEIISGISRRNYLLLSDGIIAMIMFIPVIIKAREITMHGLILGLAVIATLNVTLFLIRYIKAYQA